MIRIALLVVALMVLAPPVRAEDDAAARAERWAFLKDTIFQQRPVQDGAGVIGLDAPARALDAALVPITVTLARPVRTVWLLVDENPSPLVGTFHFGPAADPATLKTRIRVDQYTLVHAVAETEDGQLYMAERFVKAAGGCSAPSTKDAVLAMQRLGKMKFRLDAGPTHGDSRTAELLISHPNNNGMQADQITHLFVPARFIQDVKVTRGEDLVFDFEADISLSEDPAITFGLRPEGEEPVTVEVRDSAQAVFRQTFEVPPKNG
jgi:sulfur-oxidizing protein SoxY